MRPVGTKLRLSFHMHLYMRIISGIEAIAE
jgi:hypothetical protein